MSKNKLKDLIQIVSSVMPLVMPSPKQKLQPVPLYPHPLGFYCDLFPFEFATGGPFQADFTEVNISDRWEDGNMSHKW